MKRLLIASSLLVSTLLVGCSNTVKLSAPAGAFAAETLFYPSIKRTLNATIQVTKLSSTQIFPGTAYIGFHEGNNRQHSIQVLVSGDASDPTKVNLKYRVLDNSKEVASSVITSIPRGTDVPLSLSIDYGLVKIASPLFETITVRTHLIKVSPYVSVSSADATFIIE